VIRRREFITLIGGAAAAWPLAARAQQGERIRRIGVLMNLAADDPAGQVRLAAFVQGLQQLGWAEGRNMRIDARWAAGYRAVVTLCRPLRRSAQVMSSRTIALGEEGRQYPKTY
jgi:DNA-binding LacI/PurR family transcriptional regulator